MSDRQKILITPVDALKALAEREHPANERCEDWDQQWDNLRVASGEKCCIGGPQWGHAWDCKKID